MSLEEFTKWAIEIYREFRQDEKIEEVYRNDEKIMLVDIESEKLYTYAIPKLPVNTYISNMAMAYAKFKGYEIPVFTKPERVKMDEPYYFINLDVKKDFCIGVEQHNITDNMRYNKHNYFAQVNRAEKTVDKIKFLLKLEYFHSIYCPDFEPNWNDSNENKYYISYNSGNGDYFFICSHTLDNKTTVYFPTQEIVQKVCDELNKELTE